VRILIVAALVCLLVLGGFLIWLARKSKGGNLPEPAPGLAARQLIKNARVLVVDDTLSDQELARALMEPYGLLVDCVSTGKEAQERIRAGKPKYRAIFLDLHMAGMSGTEVLRGIRIWVKSDYARNIPVIAYTADAGDPKVQARLLDDGFQDSLPKPVDLEKLDKILQKWVKVSRTQPSDLSPSDPLSSDPLSSDPPHPAQVPQIPAIPEIPEIEMESVLPRFHNDLSAYIRVLGSFLVNTPPILGRLKAFGSPQSSLRDYVVAAHSLKGSCRSLGAEALGNMAEYLEHAARREDIESIGTHNASFIKNMERFLQNIQTALKEFSGHS
jgi:CheY-like chemotaxis protein